MPLPIQPGQSKSINDSVVAMTSRYGWFHLISQRQFEDGDGLTVAVIPPQDIAMTTSEAIVLRDFLIELTKTAQ